MWFANVSGGEDPLPCWVYATDGLERYGQSEIVMLLCLRDNEQWNSHPEDPIPLLRAIATLAATGRHAHTGQVTAGPNSLLDQEAFGVLYTPLTVQVPGVTIATGARAAVLLRCREAQLLLGCLPERSRRGLQ